MGFRPQRTVFSPSANFRGVSGVVNVQKLWLSYCWLYGGKRNCNSVTHFFRIC